MVHASSAIPCQDSNLGCPLQTTRTQQIRCYRPLGCDEQIGHLVFCLFDPLFIPSSGFNLMSGSYKSAPIAAKFWLVRPPAAAVIEKGRSRKASSTAALFYCGSRSRRAKLCTVLYCGSSTAALFYCGSRSSAAQQ